MNIFGLELHTYRVHETTVRYGTVRVFTWDNCTGIYMHSQRNWAFATKSDFLITISLEPNVADLRYFKLWILLDQIIWVWNLKDLQHRVLKLLRFKYLILFQRLNSFIRKFIYMQFCIVFNRSYSTNTQPIWKRRYPPREPENLMGLLLL